MANQEDNSELKRGLFMVSDAVIGAAVLLMIGGAAGTWLDKSLHSGTSWCSIIGAMLGGTVGLVRMVMKANALDSGKKSSSSKAIKASQTKEQDLLKTDASDTDKNRQRLPFERHSDEEN
ncbi:MAG: hypothetical protein K2X27_01190 [Candidatus Obscuribacterales bacterium]|nr:hypothetical protein [Candidatus Obscuribacterales bacterium]